MAHNTLRDRGLEYVTAGGHTGSELQVFDFPLSTKVGAC